jgi:hypothetical protein
MKMLKRFEGYMSREELCSALCRCGYSMNDLEVCSMQELESMYNDMMSKDMNSDMRTGVTEKKGEKWIKDAIKKPGSLRKSMKKEEGEKITKSEIDSELQALKGKDKDKDKKGVQGLSKKDLTKYRRLNLAKTLKGLKEHQGTSNYMFFGNLKTIKRLVDEMLAMDEDDVDAMLSNGHNWAVDHIATSKDDVEEVFNFLAGHDTPTEDQSHAKHYAEPEPSFEETEGDLAKRDLEDEMKNIKSFGNFK